MYVDFYELLEKLKVAGRKFDTKALKQLAYTQLDLAAIGNAGCCKCSPSLVTKEKALRRKAYAVQDENGRAFLERAGMLADALQDASNAKGHPTIRTLGVLEHLWYKLTCLATHSDAPSTRLVEVVNLLQLAIDRELLPNQVALSLKAEFQSIILRQSKISDELIRGSCDQCAGVVRSFLTPSGVAVCEGRVLADYSCSSFCFRDANEN